jgi:hypothetical protein
MSTRRVIALVIGCVLLLPGLGMLVGGGALGIAAAVQRDDDGYFATTIDRLESPTAAVTSGDLMFAVEPGTPAWLIDRLDADIRLRVTTPAAGSEVFVGIGRSLDVDAYLAGTAHDEVERMDGRTPEFRSVTGSNVAGAPTAETFWTVSSTGTGTQEVTWEATSGRWTAVLMNADGSPGIRADVEVGARSGAVVPVALTLLVVGAVLSAVAIALIVFAAAGRPVDRSAPSATPTPPTGDAGVAGVAGPVPSVAPVGPARSERHRHTDGGETHPVRLAATLDPGLSRWKWLVKWFLAIPHFVVLAFLWTAFAVLTLVAGVAVLFTGRYPRGIFDLNVGVLRWTWRVSYYATTGGIGTDRYPPFSLSPQPDDPATLTIAYPESLVRWKVLVKWFLAIPHLLIVALLAGASIRWFGGVDGRFGFDLTGGSGLLGILVVIAGVALLFTGRYPATLFDLIVGFNRWIYRVIAYVALMTDRYPPFRLDQGGDEPVPSEPPTPPAPLPPPAVGAGDEPSADRELQTSAP